MKSPIKTQEPQTTAQKAATASANKSAAKKKKNAAIKDFVTWFEIPAYNFDRAVSFFNYIYDFELETTEMNGYKMGFFPTSKGITGAVIAGEGSIPSDHGPLIYLNGGKDLNEVLSKVEEAGGRVLLQKTLINESTGHFALFLDTEGNKLALHSKS